MFLTLFLILGYIGGSTLLLIMLIVFGLPLFLIILVVWRWFRPRKPALAPVSVADELVKLQQLREQDVLTEQEFEEQKRRLLR